MMERVYFNNIADIEKKVEELKRMIDEKEIIKGVYIPVEFMSEKKVRKSYLKDHPDTKVIKVSRGLVRLGIDYTNTEYYKTKENKVIDGTRPIADHFLKGYEHFIIESEKGYKVQMFASKTQHKMESQYYLNGVEVDKKDLEDIILKEQVRPESEFIVFNVWLQNLISIG